MTGRSCSRKESPVLVRWLFLVLMVASPALADEGMWTLNNFPKDAVKQKYGFEVTPAFLDHVKSSAVRIAGGCSASLVSPAGLVMTNHHCAHSCIEQLSTGKKDFIANGFTAKTPADEVKCPNMEINQLQDITDVTDRIGTATQGLFGKPFNDALKSEQSKIEKECATDDRLRCDVVTLYRGGKYNLYKYRRFQDIRLVFAPEFSIAFFGGDPDNFEFPRYDLDVSFVRIYDDNKPLKSSDYFRWSAAGAKEGELTFVTGNPGRTSRGLSLSELAFARDYSTPQRLLHLAQLRGMITEYQARGAEQRRHANAMLFGVENSFKALRGREATLIDPKFWAAKTAEEASLKQKVAADPKLAATTNGAWAAIAQSQDQLKPVYPAFAILEEGQGFLSDTYVIARTLLRLSDELPKPNDKRLREYADSNLPAVKARVFTNAPIYDEFEIEKLTFSLTRMREELGADSAVVKKVLGVKSPREVATALVKGTKLRDAKLRKQLFDGGKKALEDSKDPMIQFARLTDPDARAVRQKVEDEIDSVQKKNDGLIARARFAINGSSIYPDATLSLRVSYGAVQGYTQANGRKVEPFTTFGGAFEHATGAEPFQLPKAWLAAKPKLNLTTPLDFVTNNDIIGGNSGSPVINKEGQIVGLVFDGNRESLGGDVWYDPTMNRTVAVHSAALLQALDKVYGAKRVLEEIQPRSPTGTSTGQP